MLNKSKWVSAAVALTAFSTLATVSLTAAPANAAVVYCKTAGVPQGCRRMIRKSGFPKSMPSGSTRGILRKQKAQARRRSIEPSRLQAQAPALSLSGKRRGKVSLTRVPPAPELSSSFTPQRAARFCILRKPRAAL